MLSPCLFFGQKVHDFYKIRQNLNLTKAPCLAHAYFSAKSEESHAYKRHAYKKKHVEVLDRVYYVLLAIYESTQGVTP